MKDKHKLFGKICQSVNQEKSFYKRSSLSKPTRVAGSPYQKDDSLYDDYDGENAAGQWRCHYNDNWRSCLCVTYLIFLGEV